MDDSSPLASLSLTHVYYDPDDIISLLCAYLALLPQALCVVYATLVLATREVEVALMFAGQLASAAFNFALKRLIKEERPRRIHGKGYGMPSSHAQFVVFWSVSLALFLLARHSPPNKVLLLKGRRVQSSFHRPWSVLERLVVSLGALAVAVATGWSRVYLNYHTPKQVLVGSGAGVVIAVVWFAATTYLRRSGWLAWGLNHPIARAFRLRDLAVEEDMCQAGWEKWEERNEVNTTEKQKSK